MSARPFEQSDCDNMSSSLQAPVLQVDANVIHQVDTSNAQNLFSMWTVFARCKDSVAQGKRLENLSWRLWTRETFCVESAEAAYSCSTSRPREIQRPARQYSTDDMPQLSGSVDSIASEEAVEFSSDSSSSGALDIAEPRIRRQDSWSSNRSRGRERHITSDDLEKMVVSIIEQKESITSPLPEIPASMSPPKQSHALDSPPSLQRSGSTSSEESPDKDSDGDSDSSLPASSPELSSSKTTTVVHGFSPSSHTLPHTAACSPCRASTTAEIPEPKSMPAPKLVEPKKRAMFALGASSEESYADSDQGQSLEKRNTLAPPKKKMFMVGGSSEEESSLKSALASPRNPLTGPKKTASFAKQVSTQTIPAPAVFDDDDESDYLDESAIDDDDEGSDWEDSNEESGHNSVDDKIAFSRVDSKVFEPKANLPSRRSLITLMVEQNQRRGNLGNAASRSTPAIPHRARQQSRQPPSLVPSPNDSDEAPLMMKSRNRGPPLKPITEVPRSSAQPIMTTANGTGQQTALSPRTTRRNMLSTELTESLRRHLLWERSQKSSTANAVLKRRHTSHDVANLKQYPERPFMAKDNNDVNASSWDQEFTREAFSGYHSKGW